MPARFDTDNSRWPLVVVTIPDQDVTDDEVKRFIEGQRAQLARREKHVVLTDARRAKVLSPLQRQLFGAWLKEAEIGTKRYTVALAIVIDNALVRGALTAVLWVVEPACPTKMVGTLAEGAQWLLEQGNRAGLGGLEGLRAYLGQQQPMSASR